ncbi:MAG: hypothetical protein FD152_4020 [Xanthobacteraceae bacterium]|nr:MAG: hypothetical protein FD152_4020 [Xanthobacteraceae bacterium]
MVEAATFDTSAHYLMAAASIRSGVADGPSDDGLGTGPFALTAREWALFATQASISLNFQPGDIDSWEAQCTVFAVMTTGVQKRIAARIGSQPNSVELYLAQMLGVDAALAALKDGSADIATVIGAVAPDVLAAEGLDATEIAKRHGTLLKAKAAATIKAIEKQLEVHLAAAAPFIKKVGADAVASAETALHTADGANLRINFESKDIKADRRQWAQLIALRFQERGYGTVQQIAAIANAIGESGLNPTIKSPDPENSYGLFQLNLKGVGHGYDPAVLKDPDKNISIMLDYIAKQGQAQKDFAATSSIETAVAIFVRKFERPKDTAGAIAARVPIARRLII